MGMINLIQSTIFAETEKSDPGESIVASKQKNLTGCQRGIYLASVSIGSNGVHV